MVSWVEGGVDSGVCGKGGLPSEAYMFVGEGGLGDVGREAGIGGYTLASEVEGEVHVGCFKLIAMGGAVGVIVGGQVRVEGFLIDAGNAEGVGLAACEFDLVREPECGSTPVLNHRDDA